jgi:hypothetical protein
MALLKTINFTVGNKTRFRLDYSEWLEDGSTLASGTAAVLVVVPAITDVIVSAVSVDAQGHLVFFVAGGSVNEVFTIAVQAVDSRGEIKNDTISFSCVAP